MWVVGDAEDAHQHRHEGGYRPWLRHRLENGQLTIKGLFLCGSFFILMEGKCILEKMLEPRKHKDSNCYKLFY